MLIVTQQQLPTDEATIKKGSITLFFIQVFSTLSFAVLYSTLIFYLTSDLKINDKLATNITAEFLAISYILHLLGGLVGGRLFNFRVLLVISMLLQLIGLLLLSIAHVKLMYWALAIYLSGNGFNMTCINSLITQLFTPEDPRREKFFLWNYSGMNIGYLVGFSMGGYFLLQNNYSLLFALSAVASLMTLTSIFMTWSYFKNRDVSSSLPVKSIWRYYLIALILLILLIILLAFLLQHTQLNNILMMATVAATLFFITYFAYHHPERNARNKIWFYMLLFIAALCFYIISQLGPTGLNLFIHRNVNLHIAGIIAAPQWLQNINPIVIIICAPLLAYTYKGLRNKGYQVSIPSQFAFALIIIGLSLVILRMGIYFSDSQGFSNILWAILSIALQGFAEASFTPIGFAMVGQLAPPQLRGFLVGHWLTCIGMGAIFAGYFSQIALKHLNDTNPLITNANYSHIFNILGWSAISIGVLMWALGKIFWRKIN